MIQYSETVLIIREFTAYWMPAFRGYDSSMDDLGLQP
jgi:hypothetical protein